MFTTQGLKAIKYRISIMFPGNNSSPPVPRYSNLVFFTYLDTDKIKNTLAVYPMQQGSNKQQKIHIMPTSKINDFSTGQCNTTKPRTPYTCKHLFLVILFGIQCLVLHACISFLVFWEFFFLFACCFFNLLLSVLKRLLENRVSKQTLMFQTTTCNYSVHRRILKS